MTTAIHLLDSLADAAAILLPARCAGCGEPDRSLCVSCRRDLAPAVAMKQVGNVSVWSALEYSGTVRRVLLAFKESGRVDVAPALGIALRDAVVAAQRASPAARGALLPVLIPSTAGAKRRRGFHPTATVLRRTRILVPPLRAALRLTRTTRDQAALSSAERAANRAGSLRASPRLRGRCCLIVDDIVTTGATIAEAARAIEKAGGIVVGAATIAQTPRRVVAEVSANKWEASSG